MAKLDFPDTPATGELYGSSGTVWRWDGARWASTAGASGARGRVAYAQITVDQAGFTGVAANVTNLLVTWTADPSRTYRISAHGEMSSTVVSDSVAMYITDGGGIAQGRTAVALYKAGYSHGLDASVVQSGLSGVITRKVQAARIDGTGTCTVLASPNYPAFILVEDITYEAGTSGTPGTGLGAWQNLVLGAGFAPLGSGFGAPAMRVNFGDTVQFRGTVSVVTTIAVGADSLIAGVLIPATSRIMSSVGWGTGAYGDRPAQLRVRSTDGALTVIIDGGTANSWPAGSWITLDGVSYTLT